MKILLADHFGMCFGVRDAIAAAENVARQTPLTILGELVHNPIVRERLRAQGIGESSEAQTPPAQTQPGLHVMITAHGVSEKKREELRTAGWSVVDGTCPLVRQAHSRLQELVAAGFFPVVIGQPGHVEVRGLTGDYPEVAVIDTLDHVAQLAEHARYGVISQTTQPIEKVYRLVAAIRRAHPQSEVRFVDTVCRPTKDRQLALQRLIEEADVIVVVGGRTSNNTHELVETCRTAGRRAIHVERADEIVPGDFVEAKVVGLTAGTSTLLETVEEVHRRLQKIGSGGGK